MKFKINRTRKKLPLPPEVGAITQESDHERAMGYGSGVVEFESLEQVVAFCQKYGEIIFIPSKDGVRLEIYDDHRE